MRLQTLLPIAVFTCVVTLFGFGMLLGDREVPSALAGQPAPDIEAVPLGEFETFSSEVFADGEVKIVNFFASWCGPCRAEHGDLMLLAEEGVPIYGINKDDKDPDALAFLAELGNPYAGIIVDAQGRQSLEWGVIAVPETFIIDGEGRIVRRFAGPIVGVMDTIIRPALAEAEGG